MTADRRPGLEFEGRITIERDDASFELIAEGDELLLNAPSLTALRRLRRQLTGRADHAAARIPNALSDVADVRLAVAVNGRRIAEINPADPPNLPARLLGLKATRLDVGRLLRAALSR
jgi:hypothetical protein